MGEDSMTRIWKLDAGHPDEKRELTVSGIRDDMRVSIHHSDYTVESLTVVLSDEVARELAVELFKRAGMTTPLVNCISREVARMMSKSYADKEAK